MKNKNIIIIVAISVAALAVLIGGIIWGVSEFGGDAGKDKESTSQTDSDKKDDTSAEETVSGGKLETEDVKVNAGGTVTVPIKLDKNPGINACQLIFEYDTNALTLVGFENGDILDQCESNGNMVIIYDSGIKDITKNGTLVTLEFAVKNSAAKGEYQVKLAADSMIVNADEAVVIADISLGSVVVE